MNRLLRVYARLALEALATVAFMACLWFGLVVLVAGGLAQ